MDSGTSGGSMPSGSSCDEDQHGDTVVVSSTISVPQPHQHQQQQPVLLSTHHHLQYPTLNNNSNSFGTTTNYHMSFMDQFLQPDPDPIWSMNIHNTQPRASTTAAPAQSFSLPASENIVQPQQKPQQKPNLVPSASSGAIVEQAASITQPGQIHGSSSTRVTKKRTRASRKTPTTVLATDTSNFRAMVQEFTGIPTPPFGPASSVFSSSSSSKKFDLFGSGLDPSLGSLLYGSLKSNNNQAILNNMRSSHPYAPPPMAAPAHASLLYASSDHSSPTSYQPQLQAALQNHNLNVTFQPVMQYHHPFSSSSVNYSTGAGNNTTGSVISAISGFSTSRQNVEHSIKGQEGDEHNHSIPSTHG